MQWTKTKYFKYLNKTNLTIGALVGVLLLLIAIPTDGKKTGNESPQTQSEQESSMEYRVYKKEMEQELCELLTQVRGAGQVRVMITFQASELQKIEKDQKTGENTMEETTVYADQENGSKVPYVVQTMVPKAEGIVVLCDGGGDARVREEITEAVQALFDVDTHKIKIMKGKSKQE